MLRPCCALRAAAKCVPAPRQLRPRRTRARLESLRVASAPLLHLQRLFRGPRLARTGCRRPHRRDAHRGGGGAGAHRVHHRRHRPRLHQPESCQRSRAAVWSPRPPAAASPREAAVGCGAGRLLPHRVPRCAARERLNRPASGQRVRHVLRVLHGHHDCGAASHRHAAHRGRRVHHRGAARARHRGLRHRDHRVRHRDHRVRRRGLLARRRDRRRDHRVRHPGRRGHRGHLAHRVARHGLAGRRHDPCARFRPPGPAASAPRLQALAQRRTISSTTP